MEKKRDIATQQKEEERGTRKGKSGNVWKKKVE